MSLARLLKVERNGYFTAGPLLLLSLVCVWFLLVLLVRHKFSCKESQNFQKAEVTKTISRDWLGARSKLSTKRLRTVPYVTKKPKPHRNSDSAQRYDFPEQNLEKPQGHVVQPDSKWRKLWRKLVTPKPCATLSNNCACVCSPGPLFVGSLW